MGASAAATIERDMAATLEDFRRILPIAATNSFRATGVSRAAAVEFSESAGNGADEHIIVATCQDRRVGFVLANRGERELGAMRLPATRVRITFDGFSGDSADRFLACFDAYFRRGGG